MYDGKFEICPHCGYAEGDGAKELYHLYPGTILNDRYIVGQVLGFGGFGITYMVWDKTLNTVMAIKEYYPGGLVNRVPGTKNVLLFTGNRLREYNHGLMRFLDEARSMAKFSSHKNIINIFEYFEENDTAYIVMEYLEGTTLNDFLKNNRMDTESSIEVISHVSAALKDVHGAGIVHRDVSPDNIFLCTNGTIKLIDFGAARFSSDEEQQRTIILKPGFAPPEQYEKVNIQGPWTDIYALGATMYYMITGVKPEESTNRKIEDTLQYPHEIDETIPEYISNTIMQAMAIDKHVRFSSISDFEKAVNQEKKVLPVAKQIKRRKRRRLIGLVAASLVIIISASIFYVSWDRQRAEETLPDASISIAFFVTGDEEFDSARETALSAIIEAFGDSFPNVIVDMRAYPLAEYEAHILEAISNGDSPTLFESTGFSAAALERTLDLSRVVNQLRNDEVHFLNEYSTYFPERNQLPLGFTAPVLFLNTTLSNFAETGIRNLDDFLLANSLADLDVAVNPVNKDIFLHAFDGIGVETSDYARYLFLTGEASAYFSNTSAFFEVQRALPARYRLIYIDVDSPAARFTDLWSISQYAQDNERQAAERFLRFMLSDNAQDLLHIRNRSGNLPVNRYVLDVFSEVYNDFYGFFSNIESYTFMSATMPHIALAALARPPVELPFTDVEGHWAIEGIRFVFEEGIMNGATSTTFAPDDVITRAMAVATLYRMGGMPSVTFEPIFDDVPIDRWYSYAVTWASQNEIISSGRSFAPNSDIVLEQFLVMLYRYAELNGYSTSVPTSVALEIDSRLADDYSVSSWARDAMRWAVYHEIVHEDIDPQSTVTRAGCAAMLHRISNI